MAAGKVRFTEEQSTNLLLRALVQRLPSGEMIFDTFNRFAIRHQKANPVVRRAKATLRWGIDDPRELELLGLTTVRVLTAEDIVRMQARGKLSVAERFQFALLTVVPVFRTVAQVMHFRFGPDGD